MWLTAMIQSGKRIQSDQRRINQRCSTCRASKKREVMSLDASIAALAIPALGTELIDPLLSACDTAFVGRIGPEPLAGVGIASSVFTYTFLFFNFLSTASSPLITQALARSVQPFAQPTLARPSPTIASPLYRADRESARTIVGNAITLALLLGVVCVLLLEINTKAIIEVVAGTGDMRDSEPIRIAISYLKYASFRTMSMALIRQYVATTLENC